MARWHAQAALTAHIPDGTEVVAADEMQAPLIAVHPRVRFVPAVPRVALEPVAGGLVVRERVGVSSTVPCDRLAVAASLEGAMELGRRAWGDAAFKVSDGQQMAAARCRGGALPGGDIATAPVAGPATGAPDVFAQMREIGEVEIEASGDGVLWLDALQCLRGLTVRIARRIAWRGRLDCTDLADLHLAVPDGRVKLRFEEVRARPRLGAGGACQVRWSDDRTAEIDTGARPTGIAALRVHAPRARLARVGIVIATGSGGGEFARPDPLAVYADPLGLERR